MPAPRGDASVTRTHALLTELTAEAAEIRRSMDRLHACRGCSKCDALRLCHAKIDDHLEWLDLYALDPEPELDDCGLCGLRRYRATDGTTACAKCDGLTGGRTWVGIPDSEPA